MIAHARDRNFSGMFPWVDALFGTQYLPDRQWPLNYGVDDPMPSGYLRQLMSPFRRRHSGPEVAPVPVPLTPCAEPSSTTWTPSSSR